MTDLRRSIFRVTGGRAQWIDSYLRSRLTTLAKRRAWFNDQYRHPHESKHTFDEVLEWFDRVGVKFVRSVPSLTTDDDGLGRSNLFEPTGEGTWLEHFLIQLREIVTGSREGGFFIMIGRKPAGGGAQRTPSNSHGDGAAHSYETTPA
jgi:hypothetical protein